MDSYTASQGGPQGRRVFMQQSGPSILSCCLESAKETPFFFWFFYFVLGYSRLTVSEGAQPYIHIYPFFPKLPSRLPHNIKHSSLCCTVGPWLSILNRQCVHVHPKLPDCPFPISLPLATISLFSKSVSLFVLWVSSSVSFFLDFTIRDVLRYFSREPLLVLCFVMSAPSWKGKNLWVFSRVQSASLHCCIVFLWASVLRLLHFCHAMNRHQSHTFKSIAAEIE